MVDCTDCGQRIEGEIHTSPWGFPFHPRCSEECRSITWGAIAFANSLDSNQVKTEVPK